jgi:ArsR family transcriptional regulator, lead/cadmium/zinc/bismuth-responsive transcriptional repressor
MVASGGRTGESSSVAELTRDEVHDLSEIFAALADPTRVRIIYSILGEERSVGEIASRLDLSEPTVSQHLRRLKALRVVERRQAGRYRYYQLDDEHVETLLSMCLDHVRTG